MHRLDLFLCEDDTNRLSNGPNFYSLKKKEKEKRHDRIRGIMSWSF